MNEQRLKRFVLMGGAIYYACGGFEDYLGSYDTKEEAITARDQYLKEQGEFNWAHVGDIETGEYWAVLQPEATMARFCK